MIKGPLGLLVVSDTMNDEICVSHIDLVMLSQEQAPVVMIEEIKEAA